jgi:hypothetical protein
MRKVFITLDSNPINIHKSEVHLVIEKFMEKGGIHDFHSGYCIVIANKLNFHSGVNSKSGLILRNTDEIFDLNQNSPIIK